MVTDLLNLAIKKKKKKITFFDLKCKDIKFEFFHENKISITHIETSVSSCCN